MSFSSSKFGDHCAKRYKLSLCSYLSLGCVFTESINFNAWSKKMGVKLECCVKIQA